MVYLHKSVFQSHGYLSSVNCHVDNRWVLKISGFALHAFRKENCREQVNKRFFGTRFSAAVCTIIVYLTLLFILITVVISLTLAPKSLLTACFQLA